MSKEQNKDLFYTQSSEEVLKNLDSSVEGLSTAQAQERLANYGRNELEEGEKRSLLAKFLDQFKDLMIIILLVANGTFCDYRRNGRSNGCHYHLGRCCLECCLWGLPRRASRSSH